MGKKTKRADDEVEDDTIYPKNFRECNITSINFGVNLKSTYDNETLDFMLGRCLSVLKHLEKREGERDE